MHDDPDFARVAAAMATRVRTTRLALGWTLDVLAQRSGLEVRHLQLIESDTTSNPTMATLLRLARGLGVEPGVLLGPPEPTAEVESPPRRELAPDSAETCARRVRLLRLQHGWTQPELADRVGLSITAIQSVEANKKSPTLRSLDSIAAAFQVETWTLLVPLSGELEPVRARARHRG